MSVTGEAFVRAEAFKERSCGGLEHSETVDETAARGEQWMKDLFASWGLHVEDMVDAADIGAGIALTTIANLMPHLESEAIDPATFFACLHSSGFSNGLALGLEIARQQLQPVADPRELGGDISGPGGPFDYGEFVIDATKAILADELDIAKVDPEQGARGQQEMFATLIGGRINQTQDRAKVMLFGDLDWMAAVITQMHGVAERAGLLTRLHQLCQERWNDMPHPGGNNAAPENQA